MSLYETSCRPRRRGGPSRRSSPRSATGASDTLATRWRAAARLGLRPRSTGPTPRGQKLLDLAHDKGQHQGERDGADEGRENLRDRVERARLEDSVAKSD